MKKFRQLYKKQRGTVEFPVQYSYVDSGLPHYHMPFHWNREWELLRVVKGEFLITLDDEQRRIKAGEIVLIAGEVLHGGETFDCIYESLVFDLYGLFNKIDVVKPWLRPFYRLELVPDRFFTNEDRHLADILDIFANGVDSPCLELETLTAVAGLFVWLIKEERYQKKTSQNGWPSRIKPVLEYIEQHYSKELSLDILADVAGLSEHYFCKVFYALTHMTPMNYVNFFRIEQASILLDVTDKSITEVASDCGFGDSSYFTKVFKKYKGINPRDYRRQLHAEHAQKV